MRTHFYHDASTYDWFCDRRVVEMWCLIVCCGVLKTGDFVQTCKQHGSNRSHVTRHVTGQLVSRRRPKQSSPGVRRHRGAGSACVHVGGSRGGSGGEGATPQCVCVRACVRVRLCIACVRRCECVYVCLVNLCARVGVCASVRPNVRVCVCVRATKGHRTSFVAILLALLRQTNLLTMSLFSLRAVSSSLVLLAARRALRTSLGSSSL